MAFLSVTMIVKDDIINFPLTQQWRSQEGKETALVYLVSFLLIKFLTICRPQYMNRVKTFREGIKINRSCVIEFVELKLSYFNILR